MKIEGITSCPPEIIESRLERDCPLSPEEFAQKYPFLARNCQSGQLQDGRFILEPQACEDASFGVFFYPLGAEFEKGINEGAPTLLVRTKDLFSRVDSVKRAMSKGVLVMPSAFYRQQSERVLVPRPGNLPISIREGLEAQRKLYEEWPVLNEAKTRIGLRPVFSIPARMEIGFEVCV